MKDKLTPTLKIIAILTILSGFLQMVRPHWVLTVVGAEITPTSGHFFAIVGMFMVLFGGLLLQVLFSKRPHRTALFWCGLQKLGATVAVGIGVARDIFSWLALGIVGFDFFSCVLILAYWWILRGPDSEAQ